MTVLIEAAGRYEAAVGETVVLRLAENPGTGYRWEVTAADGLELVADAFEPPASAAPGAEGHRSFTVFADRPGTAHLHVERRRAWEPAAVETCEVEVQVTQREGYQR